MTIKEIAELCRVNETTVLRWIGKVVDGSVLNCKMQLRNNLKEKLDRGSPEHPSDYDLEETLAIIRDGGKNKTLAALLAENAANKDQLVVYNSRHDRLRDEIEAIIDNKIQAAFQGIGEKLDEMRYLMAIPAPAADKSLENIMQFVKNHIVFTGNHYDHVKQCDVWALFKHVTPDHGKMKNFITRFCMIYGQDRDFKVKNIRAFAGFRLKDTRGVCYEGWDS